MRFADVDSLSYFDVLVMLALHSSLKTDVRRKPGFYTFEQEAIDHGHS